MQNFSNQGQQAIDKNVEEERKMMETWPKTKAPQEFTQTPIPIPYTNPPIVVPDIGKPLPPPKPSETNAPAQRDTLAEAGAGDGMDFRTDMSEYQLIVVKDKHIPDVTGYNPRAKLKFFPKGNMPGSNETFYLVTHRFADRAGIMAEHRGQITIKSDSQGRPQAPLRAEAGAAGGAGVFRKEMAGGTTDSAVDKTTMDKIKILLIAIAVLFVFIAVASKANKLPFRS